MDGETAISGRCSPDTRHFATARVLYAKVNSSVVLRRHSLSDVAFPYCLSLAYIIAGPLFRRILRGRFNNPDR